MTATSVPGGAGGGAKMGVTPAPQDTGSMAGSHRNGLMVAGPALPPCKEGFCEW